MTTKPPVQQNSTPPLIPKLVERIADHRDVNPDDPNFCLYDDTDPEALKLLFEETPGPVTTHFQVDDACVSVKKTSDGEISVEVEPARTHQQACD